MPHGDGKIAGALLFVGTGQLLIMMIIAEALYPGYSVSRNFISDLGVGRTAILFNGSLVVTGILTLVSSKYIKRLYDYKPLTALMVITSLGAIGVGIFPEDTGMPHIAFALMDFVCGASAALVAAKVCANPMKTLGIVSAAASFIAMAIMAGGVFLGLGVGGMERMVAYPMLLWMLAFGGHMIGSDVKSAPSG